MFPVFAVAFVVRSFSYHLSISFNFAMSSTFPSVELSSFLPYSHQSWLLTFIFCSFVFYICLRRPFVLAWSLTSSCPSLWSTVVISHTLRGVQIGGGYYWPYSHSGGLANNPCLLYTSPSPRDRQKSRMPSSA